MVARFANEKTKETISGSFLEAVSIYSIFVIVIRGPQAITRWSWRQRSSRCVESACAHDKGDRDRCLVADEAFLKCCRSQTRQVKGQSLTTGVARSDGIRLWNTKRGSAAAEHRGDLVVRLKQCIHRVDSHLLSLPRHCRLIALNCLARFYQHRPRHVEKLHIRFWTLPDLIPRQPASLPRSLHYRNNASAKVCAAPPGHCAAACAAKALTLPSWHENSLFFASLAVIRVLHCHFQRVKGFQTIAKNCY